MVFLQNPRLYQTLKKEKNMTSENLNENDIKFFEDVYELMKNKYPGMEDRFGMWRLHQHFELNDDELFHETTNLDTKESTLRIINKKDLPNSAIPTTWQLTAAGPTIQTWCCDD